MQPVYNVKNLATQLWVKDPSSSVGLYTVVKLLDDSISKSNWIKFIRNTQQCDYSIRDTSDYSTQALAFENSEHSSTDSIGHKSQILIGLSGHSPC